MLPVPQNPAYANVSPRYLEPKKALPPPSSPKRESIPVNPSYASVAPRYLSPRREASEAGSRNAQQDKKKGSKGSHQPISKALLFKNPKLANVHPRYLDPTNYQPDEQNSPRRLVENRHQVDRRERGWRSDYVLGSCKYFDDLKKFTDQREKNVPQPKKACKDAGSVIAAYVKDNIPIKHYQHTTAIHHEGEGSAHDESHSGSIHAGNSRGSSPSRHWSNGGWQNVTFDCRRGQTASTRNQFKMEEDRVARNIEERGRAKVPSNHVPRVATLSPGYRLQELFRTEHELSTSRQPSPEGETPIRSPVATDARELRLRGSSAPGKLSQQSHPGHNLQLNRGGLEEVDQEACEDGYEY